MSDSNKHDPQNFLSFVHESLICKPEGYLDLIIIKRSAKKLNGLRAPKSDNTLWHRPLSGVIKKLRAQSITLNNFFTKKNFWMQT